MSDHSRRGFLRRASVVAGGALAFAGLGGAGAASAQAESEDSSAPAHEGSFVAWVKDPRAGQIAVLVGRQELVYTDKKLAKQLAQVAARAHAGSA